VLEGATVEQQKSSIAEEASAEAEHAVESAGEALGSVQRAEDELPRRSC